MMQADAKIRTAGKMATSREALNVFSRALMKEDFVKVAASSLPPALAELILDKQKTTRRKGMEQ